MIARQRGHGHAGCPAAPVAVPFRVICGRMPVMADTGHRDGGPGDPLFQEFDERFTAAARFREPSAAERARKQGRLARRRRDRLSRRYSATTPQRPHHLVRTSLTLLLFLVVLAAVGWVLKVDLTARPAAAGARATASPTAKAAASHPATPRAFPVTDPFAGSPAEHFADGAAGIVPPAPHAVGRYPAAQVARAYAAVRAMLIAAHLNRRTLLGGTPAAFARLLTSQQRHFFDRHLDNHSGSSTRYWVTSFAPGSAQLAGSVVKVHGSMKAVTAVDAGNRPVLRVKADYLFVYPVQRPGAPATRMRIVVRDVEWVDFAHWDRLGGPLEPWWTPQGGATDGSRCDVNDGYVHPEFRYGAPDHVRPSGRPVDPYNQSVPPTQQKGCHATTGT